MPEPTTWPMIHSERQALADDLAGLSDEQWATPSLCAGWSVRDVLAHMTSTAKMTPPRFVGHFASAGFKFDKMSAKDIATEEAVGTPADLLAEFTRVLSRRTTPPGPVDAMVGEVIVHPEDIRRALGITHAYSKDAAVRAADFYKSSNLLIGAKNRIAGLTLTASDTSWTHGTGPAVSGPIVALVLAMTGRKAAIDDLTGDGVETLAARMP